MRGGRLITILLLLQARERMTARELAAALDVSLRTVYRDVDELSAAGVPIYAERGAHGGIRLLDRHPLDVSALAGDEATALLLSAYPAIPADLGFAEAAQRGRLKLEQALTSDEQASLARLRSLIHVAPGHPSDRADAACLQALVTAAHTCRTVRLFVAEEPPEMLEPLGVVNDGQAWWVVGAQDSRAVAFRVTAIARLEGTSTTFERPTRFDLAAAWRELQSQRD